MKENEVNVELSPFLQYCVIYACVKLLWSFLVKLTGVGVTSDIFCDIVHKA